MDKSIEWGKIISLKDIIKVLAALFVPTITIDTVIPPPLIMAGGSMKPGMSPRNIAARIISRQESAGAPMGPLPDGSNNVSEQMEIIRVEEIINAIITEAKIDVVIPPGIPVTGVGVGVGVVTIEGTTTMYASGNGVIR
jgi:hypothetical protein